MTVKVILSHVDEFVSMRVFAWREKYNKFRLKNSRASSFLKKHCTQELMPVIVSRVKNIKTSPSLILFQIVTRAIIEN